MWRHQSSLHWQLLNAADRGRLSEMFSLDEGLEVTLWSRIGLIVFSSCHHGESDSLTGCWHSKWFLTFASSWLKVWLWDLLVPEHLLEGWLGYHSLKRYQFISNHKTLFTWYWLDFVDSVVLGKYFCWQLKWIFIRRRYQMQCMLDI